MHFEDFGLTFTHPDFAAYAKAYGAKGIASVRRASFSQP
jgi:thiamine pyrophosphate-dependent acetolactate synthase large subunit-like protein